MPEPVNGVAYDFFIALADAVNPAVYIDAPTLAAGDFQISQDGTAYANLATLPTVAPGGSASVKVELSATEMTADKVTVLARDVAGAEWEEVLIFIDIPSGNSESTTDLLEGDHIETSTSLRINQRGTTTPLLQKDITGSLLSPSVTLTTTDP